MSSPEIEAELRSLAERREQVAAERSRVAAETADAVRRAKAAGLSVTRIAQLAGLSRERVHEMLRK